MGSGCRSGGGYRHIDTAEMYGNEHGVGEAVRASGLDRADVFITSKLNNGFHRPDEARRAFAQTLSELGTDYVDLFLIHWPLPTLYDGDYVSTWKTLEEFRQDGRARSIGVSNFQVEHLERLAAECDVVPAVNQIELHPYFGNDGGRRVRAGARNRDRGVGADRAGQGPRRSGTQRDRGQGRQVTGTGRSAVAHPARQHRLSQVGDSRTDQGEPGAVRLRARA